MKKNTQKKKKQIEAWLPMKKVTEIIINDQETKVEVREVQLPQSWEDFQEEHTWFVITTILLPLSVSDNWF